MFSLYIYDLPIISLLQFFCPRVIFLVHLESILMKNNCDLNFSLQIYIGCYLKQRHCLIDLKPCFGCWNLEEECLLGCMLSHKSLDSSAQSNSPPNILWTHVLILLPLSPVFISIISKFICFRQNSGFACFKSHHLDDSFPDLRKVLLHPNIYETVKALSFVGVCLSAGLRHPNSFEHVSHFQKRHNLGLEGT